MTSDEPTRATETEPTESTNIETERSDLEALGQRLVRPTIRFVVVIGFLFGIRYVFVRIPGAGTAIPGTRLTVALVAYGVVTLIVLLLVFDYATTVGAALARYTGVDDVARLLQLVTVLGLLVWAHSAYFWLPYFVDNPAQYDLLFVAAGLAVGAWLGIIVYTNADVVSAKLEDELMDFVRDSSDDQSADRESSEASYER